MFVPDEPDSVAVRIPWAQSTRLWIANLSLGNRNNLVIDMLSFFTNLSVVIGGVASNPGYVTR